MYMVYIRDVHAQVIEIRILLVSLCVNVQKILSSDQVLCLQSGKACFTVVSVKSKLCGYFFARHLHILGITWTFLKFFNCYSLGFYNKVVLKLFVHFCSMSLLFLQLWWTW